jgi:hypothetical protein
MKTLKKLILGLATSLLMTVGLVRAAEIIAPPSTHIHPIKSALPGQTCGSECNLIL